ncbi:MAG: hypothetical protein ABIQ70_08715 [Dokdonella sp.]
MTYLQSAPLLDPQFDDFLFAPIGEEKDGMLLRVVSALARLDLDPWEETANLARLPRQAATERLTEFIVSLPNSPSADLDPGAIAAGLIARLPAQPASTTEYSDGLDIPAPTRFHPLIYLALILMGLFETLAFAGSQPSTAAISSSSVPSPGKVVPESVASTRGP